ncbi:MAG: hypothetical protein VKO39_05460 [Cyanobacteriota bacterium]|nr:hypothetical protein [Cyanobacteriota bacterium]
MPPERPPTGPIVIPINNIIVNGIFNPNLLDPSWGDDSFLYYLEHRGVVQWFSYQTLAVKSHDSCTACLPYSPGLTSALSNQTETSFAPDGRGFWQQTLPSTLFFLLHQGKRVQR